MTVTRGQLKSLSRAVERAAHALKEEAENLPDAITGNDLATIDTADSNLNARLDKVKGLFLELGRAMVALEQGVGRDGGGTTPGDSLEERRADRSPGDSDFEERMAASDEERLGFGDFLAQVGGALMESQRALDVESLRYLEESRQSPHVLPSVFRIPKLSAEMKFALEKSAGRGVNLIFFQNQTLAKELHQQSIAFEMVAVPPPPDALARRAEALVDLALVLNETERAAVLTAGRAASDGLPRDADPRQVVILASRREDGYLVFYAKEEEKRLGVWLFAQGEFRPLALFAERRSAAEGFLTKLITGAAAAQGPFLADS